MMCVCRKIGLLHFAEFRVQSGRSSLKWYQLIGPLIPGSAGNHFGSDYRLPNGGPLNVTGVSRLNSSRETGAACGASSLSGKGNKEV